MIVQKAHLRLCRFLLVALLLPTAAQANVSVPALFSTSAVLQRDKPLPVWGWGAPGESATVTLGSKSATTVTGSDGRWRVELGAQPVSTQPLTLTVAGTNTLTINDVLLGDVWLCSGQSNMAMSVGGLLTPESKVDYQTANYPLIRQMGVEVTPANSPQENVTGQWLVCTPAKASQFCAVGFYFAIKVHQQTGVPIGILRSAKGSTIIECWTAEETLIHTLGIEPYPTQMRDSLALWETEKATALAAGIPADSPEFPEYPFSEIKVGTPVARRPPCRSRRAELPHRAPQECAQVELRS
jgi:sialate O-acetylesterase